MTKINKRIKEFAESCGKVKNILQKSQNTTVFYYRIGQIYM